MSGTPADHPSARFRGAGPSMDGGQALRVLVVEDCPVNQVIARRMLKSLGHHCVLATDGRAAVQRRADGFDLILMDLNLPSMHGLEAARRIRAWEAEHREMPVPIVAVTGNGERSDREACLEAGMVGFIQKPMRRAALLAVIAGQVRAKAASIGAAAPLAAMHTA